MEKSVQKKDKQPIVFSMTNDLCVWSRAGVIKSTKCVNAFNCLGCAMDQRVLTNFEEKRKATGTTSSANPRMQLLMKQGKCRHMLSGRVSYGLCSYGYNCANCAFDQMMDDVVICRIYSRLSSIQLLVSKSHAIIIITSVILGPEWNMVVKYESVSTTSLFGYLDPRMK